MEKIDFVLTWVDGSDPDWLAQRREYQPGRGTDAGESRYRDWDNLQYWFRGVEKFAPWVNKIYFVTWGHVPKWLNTAHEKQYCHGSLLAFVRCALWWLFPYRNNS